MSKKSKIKHILKCDLIRKVISKRQQKTKETERKSIVDFTIMVSISET